MLHNQSLETKLPICNVWFLVLKSTDKLASLQTLSWIPQEVPWLLTLGLPCLRGSSYNTAHILGSFFLGMVSLLNWPLSLRREGLERTLAQAEAQSCQSSNIPRIFPARLGCTVWINGNMHFPSNCFCSWRWGRCRQHRGNQRLLLLYTDFRLFD